MGLGKRMWTLWGMRRWVVLSALLAGLVAVWSVASVSLSPLSLKPRALQMATASTHVIVDTPRSSVLDLRQNTYSFQALTQRAVLLGNVIANGQVRSVIAALAHVPVAALQVAPPLTAQQPTPQAGSSNNSVGAILKSTNQYRLSIQVNPTVPMIDIYSQAPSADSAALLANAAVQGLREYMSGLATSQRIPAADQIRLLQLGAARGNVINHGIYWEVAVLVFGLAFGLACATGILFARIRRGWRMAALADQLSSA
jgi:hypothetical protein